MEDEVVISGKGSIEEGSIVKTVLRINNEVVGNVNAVPFDYTLVEPYKKEGKLEYRFNEYSSPRVFKSKNCRDLKL